MAAEQNLVPQLCPGATSGSDAGRDLSDPAHAARHIGDHRIRMGLQRPRPLQPDLQAEVRRLAGANGASTRRGNPSTDRASLAVAAPTRPACGNAAALGANSPVKTKFFVLPRNKRRARAWL